jgi:uncharacterized protein YbcC (UPF0753/DUF2309 family)
MGREHWMAALQQACGRISPVWDLKTFIAVNCLGGFEDGPFAEAVKAARAYFHAEALMPISYYQEQYRAGRITHDDLRQALKEYQGDLPVREADLFAAEPEPKPAGEVRTLAERISRVVGTGYEGLIRREMTKWCAAYFDQGQASWGMPGRDQRLYVAWSATARYDRACLLAGVGAFQKVVEELPATPDEAIEELIASLGVTPDDLADYLTRLLTRLPGWSGYVLFRSQGQPEPGSDGIGGLSDLVAMGLAYEWALVRSLGLASKPGAAWEAVRKLEAVTSRELSSDVEPTDLGARLVWQSAFERRFRLGLIEKLSQTGQAPRKPVRPSAQVVFCIDVRSEVFRRHLERQGEPGAIETLGFAGFFGFPIAYRAHGASWTTARCPALLKPRFTVVEEATGSGSDWAEASERRRKALAAALGSARSTGPSSFFFVESLGLFYGAAALMRSFLPGALDWLGKASQALLGGSVATRPKIDSPSNPGCSGHPAPGEADVGIPLDEQASIARNALKIMGLTSNFARLVVLCGHGGSCDNNPYAASLDCGACGGHEGGANARVAAMALNRPEVRQRLAGWGISIPDDTCFVAARHDTTVDHVHILDESLIPASHAAELRALKEALASAGEAARRERRQRFGTENAPPPATRARDWSEVRPEWGLAGNAAFIVGHRHLTAGVSLEGRAFLHSYDWRADEDGASLEVILTAPLIVAEWINMQYFLSSVDNQRFGSGDKVLHNVVGKLGVMQGNQSDLQIGLPLQSVSDGKRLVHEPLRLTAAVQAPRSRIDSILSRHASVRRLVDNEWINLVALDPLDGTPYRYLPGGEWRPERSVRREAPLP